MRSTIIVAPRGSGHCRKAGGAVRWAAAGGGSGRVDVGSGDKVNDERPFAKDRCTRIAIIQASVLEACNRPTADVAPADLTSVKRSLSGQPHEPHRRRLLKCAITAPAGNSVRRLADGVMRTRVRASRSSQMACRLGVSGAGASPKATGSARPHRAARHDVRLQPCSRPRDRERAPKRPPEALPEEIASG
jgi:hypothetical protein